ncbi:helix-turn-helix transcriptional regulator [Exiguobacterium sp. s193]|uniref:helix-turn-helix domain-containing protein n=1 Tax=Exiguobacterium sp. s193 TaxID=2751207 RepID=UPI001BE53EAB|nr:helix-turn-helix transcriptional regulator [Exiguobacterium sp. s193]
MNQAMIPLTNYGERIQTLRERQNIDQEQLATMTETTREMIQRIEASIAHPSTSMIDRLAKALGVPYEHLLRHIWSAEAIHAQMERQKIVDLPSS